MSLSVFDDPFAVFSNPRRLATEQVPDHEPPSVDSTMPNSPEIRTPSNPLDAKNPTWDSLLGTDDLIYNDDRAFKLQTRFLSDRNRQEFETFLRNGDSTREFSFSLNDFCRNLQFTAVGRESSLFCLNKRMLRFELRSQYLPPAGVVRIHGMSNKVTYNICVFCMRLGSLIARIKYSCYKIHKFLVSDDYSPGDAILISLAECLEYVTEAIESQLVKGEVQNETRLIQIITKLQDPYRLVEAFCSILGCNDIDSSIKLTQLPDPYKLLDELYICSANFQISAPILFQIVSLMLHRVSAPWFNALEKLTGLSSSEGSILSQGISDIARKLPFLEYDPNDKMMSFNREKAPLFLDNNRAQKVIESLNCILIFSRYSKTPEMLEQWALLSPPKMEWIFSEKELDRFSKQLKNYEESTLHDQPVDLPKTHAYHNETPHLEGDIYSTPDLVNELVAQMETSHGIEESKEEIFIKCQQLVAGDATSADDYTVGVPPVASLPEITFNKLIDSQHRITNKITLDLIDVGLEKYSNLYKSVCFLSNGRFASDLEDNLFITGFGSLDIENCKNWPPTELEINQSLGDAVEKCISSCSIPDSSLNFTVKVRPDSISDSKDIHATDALLVAFDIPGPYNLIINERCCKYGSRVFSLLLRVMRVNTLIKQKRDATTRELAHFLYCIQQFIHEVIDRNWHELAKYKAGPKRSLQGQMDIYEQVFRQIHRQTHVSAEVSSGLTAILGYCVSAISAGDLDANKAHSAISKWYDRVAKVQQETRAKYLESVMINLDFTGRYSHRRPTKLLS